MKKGKFALIILILLGLLIISGCGGNQGAISGEHGSMIAFTPYPPMPNQAAAISSSPGTARDGYSLALGKGWSTISFPFNLLVSTSGFSREIQYYQDGQYHPINPSTAAPTIDCAKGYWAYQDNAATATINGGNGPAIGSVTLSAGWNLIGLPYNAAKNLSDLTLTLNNEIKPLTTACSMDTNPGSQWLYGNIQYYKNSRWYTLRYDRSGSSALQPGVGYWVFSWNEGMTLDYAPPVRANEPWVKTWGTPDCEYGQAVATDANGNIFCAGQGNGFAYLLKYNPQGNLLWKKGWGGNKFAAGWAIATDAGGNVFLGGDTNIGSSRLAAYIVKFDPNGNILWERTWRPTDGWSRVAALACDSQGNVIGCGYTNGFEEDILLLKYSPDGTPIWARSWGETGQVDSAYALTLDASDNIFVAGGTYSAGAGDMDSLVMEWDSAGNLLDAKTWGGANMDYAYSVALDADHNIYLTGSYGTGNNAMILKYDSQFNLLWSKSWGMNDDFCFGQAIKVAPDGKIYVSVTDYIYSGSCLYLLQYDSDGNAVSEKSWHSQEANELINAMAFDKDGNLFLDGYVSGLGSRWQPEVGTKQSASEIENIPAIDQAVADGASANISGFGLTVAGSEDFAGATDNVLLKFMPSYSNPEPRAQLTQLSPVSGGNGSTVTVSGANFGAGGGGGAVYFGDYVAPIISWSEAQIICTVPLEAPLGQIEVKVAINDRNSDSLSFTILGPSISGLSPDHGPAGTTITISGSNLGGGAITFSGRSAEIISTGNGSIVCKVPAIFTPGAVSVAAVANGKESNSLNFTIEFPAISGLSPDSGPVNSTITINGSNFSDSGAVKFTDASAQIISWSSSQIAVIVPVFLDSGDYDLTVTTSDDLISDPATFTVLVPQITGSTPTSGPFGTTITISGQRFGSGGTASLDGAPLNVVSWSDTQVLAVVPTGAASGGVMVTVDGKDSNNNFPFNINAPAPQAPSLSSLSPNQGGLGTTVTVNGSNFGLVTGAMYFAGRSATVWSWTGNQIVCTVPPQAWSGQVTVTNAVGTSSGLPFAINGPNIDSADPTYGEPGDLITLYGSDFDQQQFASTVVFTGGDAGQAVYWSDSEIVCRIPATAIFGNINVTVKGQVATYWDFGVMDTFVPPTPGSYYKTYGKVSLDSEYDLFPTSQAVDKYGNFYVVGYTNSWGNATDPNYYDDAFVIKYASDGHILWAKTWGGEGDERAIGCAVNSNCDLYVTGFTGSYNGDVNLFLIKYNTYGTLLYQKVVIGPDPSTYLFLQDIAGVALSKDGNVYVACGYSATNYGHSGGALAIMKFYPEGTMCWQQGWWSPEYYTLLPTAITVSDKVYVGLIQMKWYQYSEDYSASVIAVKTSCGNFCWRRNLDWTDTTGPGHYLADNWGWPNALITDSKGNLYVAGEFHLRRNYPFPDNVFQTPNYDLSRIFIAKLDSNGNLLSGWPKTWFYDHYFVNYAYDLAVDIYDNLYLTGETYEHLSGLDHLLLLKFDREGNTRKQSTFNVNYDPYEIYFTYGIAVDIDPQGNVYLTGEQEDWNWWSAPLMPGNWHDVNGKVIPIPQNLYSYGIPNYQRLIAILPVIDVTGKEFTMDIGTGAANACDLMLLKYVGF